MPKKIQKEIKKKKNVEKTKKNNEEKNDVQNWRKNTVKIKKNEICRRITREKMFLTTKNEEQIEKWPKK